MPNDPRLSVLNNLAKGVLDIQMSRNPLSSEVIVVLVDTTYDHYQDPTTAEVARIKKRAVVKKNVDMDYVQEIGELLVEDDIDHLPWVASITMTDLPRQPRQNDMILVEGVLYSVSAVRPMNRNMEGVVNLFFYPERVIDEPLDVRSVSILNLQGFPTTPIIGDDVLVDIIYCGNPKLISIDNNMWSPFMSRVAIRWQESPQTLYLSDGNNTISKLIHDDLRV